MITKEENQEEVRTEVDLNNAILKMIELGIEIASDFKSTKDDSESAEKLVAVTGFLDILLKTKKELTPIYAVAIKR